MNLQPVRPHSRIGLKGPGAGPLLESLGVAIPPGPNQFVVSRIASGALRLLRLGNSEYLIEQEGGSAVIDSILAAAPGTRAHLAPRCDFSIVLGGEGLFEGLASLCAYDFADLAQHPHKLVMTLLAGISVTFISEPTDGPPALRLWCDPGFGTYLTHCLAHTGENR
jgi:sarcosine oxidase, subunit gamma